MRLSPALIASLCAGLLGWLPPEAAGQDHLRYRGEYTRGHEVEIFCPAINAQCYWLSPQTDPAVRLELRELASVPDAEPYTPVCVVIEGRIDRTTVRTGFAEDYDGLVSITEIFGRCEDTVIVTQGDLQHHRWLLERIDGTAIDLDDRLPELEFGERMTVSGNLGCKRFSATTALRDAHLVFSDIRPESRYCETERTELESIMFKVLVAEPVVSIDKERNLLLSRDGIELLFRLEDWK
jgi:heat shock protein HslJ